MISEILRRVAIDGAVLSLLLGVMVMASLIYNPRLWLQDYPEAIKAKVPALIPREKLERGLLVIPFLTLIVVLPYLSVAGLKGALGGVITFPVAYLVTMGILQVFNLFDAVVLDYLILTLMKPAFMILPGTTREDYLLDDMGLQVRNFVKGIVICCVLSLPIAFVGSL